MSAKGMYDAPCGNVLNPLAMSSIHRVLIERRSRIRFCLGLRVRFRSLDRGCPFSGIGAVVNMSSSGVLVASPPKLTEGTRMELAIEWPWLLNGKVPLQLVTTGRVVRSDSFVFAVALRGHQFRTTSRKVTPIDAFRYGARGQVETKLNALSYVED